MKKNNKRICRCCGEYKKIFARGMCRACYQKAQYNNRYLYIITDIYDNVVYVGQTRKDKQRLMNHQCGSIATTKEFIMNNSYKIKYIDLTNLVTDMEMKFLENNLIELYNDIKPLLNKQKNIISGLQDLRQFELITYLHSCKWELYCVNSLFNQKTK